MRAALCPAEERRAERESPVAEKEGLVAERESPGAEREGPVAEECRREPVDADRRLRHEKFSGTGNGKAG